MTRHPVRVLCVPGDNVELGHDWLVATVGNSSEDGKDYYVTTDRLHGDQIPEPLQDAKTTAELIVELLNNHFKVKHRKPKTREMF